MTTLADLYGAPLLTEPMTERQFEVYVHNFWHAGSDECEPRTCLWLRSRDIKGSGGTLTVPHEHLMIPDPED